MRLQLITAAGLALVLGACASNGELVPVPGANALPAPEVGALASAAGVQLEARTDAWSGRPLNLGQDFTPILVHVTNNSGRPLAIRYQDFVLTRPDNTKTWAAIPPFNIHKTVSIERPLYRSDAFMLAPYLRPYYPGWRLYDGFPGWDEGYWGTYYPEFVNINLPTPDMLAAALPEGVLQQGGTMTGFLYFQHLPASASEVLLRQRLETPTGQVFGQIEIPFQQK